MNGDRVPALIRYHGGKVRLAPQLVALLPPHEAFIEPYGGGAAVLLAKPRSRLEVYNDLDSEIVNFFRVLRDQPDALATALALTPFAREEFADRSPPIDDVDRARRTVLRGKMGRSSGIHKSTGFRSRGLGQNTLPTDQWRRIPQMALEVASRLQGVLIEHRPALEVMDMHDNPNAVFYLDPPYPSETRGPGRDYTCEMSNADHAELLERIRTLAGRVMISGYACDLYDETLHDWRRVEIETLADRAAPRTEVIWMNFDDVLPLFQPVEART